MVSNWMPDAGSWRKDWLQSGKWQHPTFLINFFRVVEIFCVIMLMLACLYISWNLKLAYILFKANFKNETNMAVNKISQSQELEY